MKVKGENIEIRDHKDKNLEKRKGKKGEEKKN